MSDLSSRLAPLLSWYC